MSDLIIEIRHEELPSGMIAPALEGLVAGIKTLLAGVEHGDLRAFSTPRRLAVGIKDVASSRKESETLAFGPSIEVARKDGVWTKAAEGFARGKGLANADALEVVDGRIAARVRSGGEKTAELVAGALEKLVLGLPFGKSMRWGASSVRWGRPLRQILAVYGGERIPCSVAGIESSAEVVGHRRRPGTRTVSTVESYRSALMELCVVADRDERKSEIVKLLATRGVTPRPELLEEVTDLVEWPVLVEGTFGEDLLELPARLLEESMRVHQRTFPVFENGRLTNRFLVISNSPDGDAAVIAEGNRRVLAARFHDAKFFLAEDRKKPLAEHGASLSRMQWIRGLGTMADKQARVADLAAELAPMVGASPEAARAAGALCKSDLLSQMVQEFPELQGHMGRLYAEHGGMTPELSLAIEEHYLPRFAGDDLARTPAGQALALADRVDTLRGCQKAGLMPKGSADPQGLRRAANGILATLLHHGHRIRLSELFPEPDLVEFVLQRLRATLMAEGHSTDVVDAVLAAGGDEPVALRERVQALTELSRAGEFKPLMVAFKRVLNIAKDHADPHFEPRLFQHDAEHELAATFAVARKEIPQLAPGPALQRMIAMKPAIDRYFDDVMVMVDDAELRKARLGLLRATANLFLSVADFRHISTE